jgi:hypothetical protein
MVLKNLCAIAERRLPATTQVFVLFVFLKLNNLHSARRDKTTINNRLKQSVSLVRILLTL